MFDPTPSPANPPPGRGSRTGWWFGLVGIGLFLAGGVIGAILVLSVILYRAPVGPSGDSLPARSDPFPSPTISLAPSPAVSATPTATPLPTATSLPIGPAVGQLAPPFLLLDLEGNEHALESYQGQTVLLNFWAAWCPPCRQEWPELVAFAEAASAQGVVVLAVNVEEPGDVIREYVGDEPLPLAVLRDPDSVVSNLYRVTVLPTTFLVDAAGVVRQVVPGDLTMADMESMVASLSSPPP